jgi:hypothetical protein
VTTNQVMHREFIASPLWRDIRKRAIAHYGCICAACGCAGFDVHHKTYVRFGGEEILEDLEVLCRGCHDARHAILQNVTCTKRKRPWVHAAVAYRYLTQAQKMRLRMLHRISASDDLGQRFLKHKGLMLSARRMLGVNIIEARRSVYQKLLRRL